MSILRAEGAEWVDGPCLSVVDLAEFVVPSSDGRRGARGSIRQEALGGPVRPSRSEVGRILLGSFGSRNAAAGCVRAPVSVCGCVHEAAFAVYRCAVLVSRADLLISTGIREGVSGLVIGREGKVFTGSRTS